MCSSRCPSPAGCFSVGGGPVERCRPGTVESMRWRTVSSVLQRNTVAELPEIQTPVLRGPVIAVPPFPGGRRVRDLPLPLRAPRRHGWSIGFRDISDRRGRAADLPGPASTRSRPTPARPGCGPCLLASIGRPTAWLLALSGLRPAALACASREGASARGGPDAPVRFGDVELQRQRLAGMPRAPGPPHCDSVGGPLTRWARRSLASYQEGCTSRAARPTPSRSLATGATRRLQPMTVTSPGAALKLIALATEA